jgi:hypothetical protein
MKLKRKKIGDRNYNLVDAGTGEAIANAVQTGEHGRDNYPWGWDMLDGRIFGRLDARTGSSAESLKECVDYIESTANSFGLLKPVGEVDPYEIKEGQVFKAMIRGLNYFFRATQDSYGDFNAYERKGTVIPANNAKGELTEVRISHGDTVTLYVEV